MLRSWLLFAAAAFAHGVRVAPSMMPRAPTCAICMTDLALELPTTSATDDAVEDWSTWLMKARYARLRDIARSISIRRTVDEAELALKLQRSVLRILARAASIAGWHTKGRRWLTSARKASYEKRPMSMSLSSSQR